MPRALIVEIFGNAQQFASELDRAAGKTRQMGRVAGVAGLAIAGGLAVGLEKSVKAAAAAQVSTARLSQAFKSSGESMTAYTGQIDKAESAGRNLGFSNIDLRDSLGSLEIATHNHTLAIKDMGVAEDIARFKHVGLTDASKMLTMAMSGSQRATKQLGLTIQPVTSTYDALKATMKGTETAQQKMELSAAKAIDKQKTAKEVIALVTEKLHGQAQAFSQTAAGGMAQFHAQMEALQENIGNALLPTLTRLSQVLADATGWLTKHGEVAKLLIVTLGVLGGTLLAVSVYTTLATAATVIWSAITKAATAAQWLLNVALDANPIGLVVIALAALGAALYLAWTKSQTFRNIVVQVWTDIKTGALTVLNWLRSNWPIVATLLAGPFAPLVALATNAFGVRTALVNALTAVKNFALNIWSGLRGAWASAWSGLAGIVIGPIKDVISWIQTLIGWISRIHIPHISGGGGIGGALSKGFGALIPGYHGASGAIVRSPTFAMIGESGPEAVVPLNRARGASPLGGGLNLSVNLNGPVFGDKQAVARELAGAIRNELVSLGRREPNIFAGYA